MNKIETSKLLPDIIPDGKQEVMNLSINILRQTKGLNGKIKLLLGLGILGGAVFLSGCLSKACEDGKKDQQNLEQELKSGEDDRKNQPIPKENFSEQKEALELLLFKAKRANFIPSKQDQITFSQLNLEVITALNMHGECDRFAEVFIQLTKNNPELQQKLINYFYNERCFGENLDQLCIKRSCVGGEEQAARCKELYNFLNKDPKHSALAEEIRTQWIKDMIEETGRECLRDLLTNENIYDSTKILLNSIKLLDEKKLPEAKKIILNNLEEAKKTILGNMEIELKQNKKILGSRLSEKLINQTGENFFNCAFAPNNCEKLKDIEKAKILVEKY